MNVDGINRWRAWSEREWEQWKAGNWVDEEAEVEEQPRSTPTPKPSVGPRLGQAVQDLKEFTKMDDKLVTHANVLEERVVDLEEKNEKLQEELEALKKRVAGVEEEMQEKNQWLVELEAKVLNMQDVYKTRSGWVKVLSSSSQSAGK